MRQEARSVPIAALLSTGLLIGAGACISGNRSGDLAAERFGDLSNALQQRADTYAEIESACSVQQPGGQRSTLRRRPYLQQMDQRSAQLLWTSDRDMRQPAVVLRRPDGTSVESAAGRVDGTARPPEGAIQWNAALGALEPDSIYCYDLETSEGALRHAGFRTAPAPGSGRTVRLLAFGDSGEGGGDQRAVLTQMEKVPFDLVIHTGDLAYSVGSREQIERNVFRVYSRLLETFPFFPASGNHEYDTEDGAPFREAFALPDNGGVEGRDRWYSYDWGDVHFVALDTEKVGEGQAAWLDADLAANHLPWTIVYLHRPPFSSGQHGSTENVQQLFVPLFEKHHVPLVLAGHDHDYERTNPLNGVTYVVTGGGGAGTRPVGQSWFTAFAESVCHFLYITVADRTLTLHAIDGTGTEFDSLVLRI